MPDTNQTKDLTSILRDLSSEIKSKDFEEMRLRLIALAKIDEVLASLKETYDIRIYRGTDVVEDYKRSREEVTETVTPHSADYMVRKDNVEIQLEVKLKLSEGFFIETRNLEHYHRILRENAKTEEIVLVWTTDELHSIALGLDDIQHYLSLSRKQRQPTEFNVDRMSPLKETIEKILKKHRPVFQEPTSIREMRKVDFDLSIAFSNILDAKLSELKESAQRRKTIERMIAINSISDSDKEKILRLFESFQKKEISIENLKENIEALSKDIDLEQDEQ